MRAVAVNILCSVITAFAVVIAFGPGIVDRMDKKNDPAMLKERIARLEEQVAALQKELATHQADQKNTAAPALTGDEKEKFNGFLAGRDDDERKKIEADLHSMADEQRIAAIRRFISMTPADLERAKRRSQAERTLRDLRLLDSACDQYAIETCKTTGNHPAFNDLKNYLRPDTLLYKTGADVFGHTYGPFTIDSIPAVSPETFNALSDVADDSFWTPYK